jgi:hypothetical protein
VAFFLNQAAAFLARAEQGGLQSVASQRRFLFASWLALAAAEGIPPLGGGLQSILSQLNQ